MFKRNGTMLKYVEMPGLRSWLFVALSWALSSLACNEDFMRAWGLEHPGAAECQEMSCVNAPLGCS